MEPQASVRTGTSVAELKAAFIDNLLCALGRGPRSASPNDIYMALALTVRDRVVERSVLTLETYFQTAARSTPICRRSICRVRTWGTTS